MESTNDTDTNDSEDSQFSLNSDSSGTTFYSYSGGYSVQLTTDDSNDVFSTQDEYESTPSSDISLTGESSQRAMENEEDSVASVASVVSVAETVETFETASEPHDDQSNSEDTSEPPAKVRKLSSPTPNDDVDGETCPICLDSWSNSGEHRLVALKCGHLFGAKCVEKWIRGKGSKDRCCPTCKTKATIKDIRHIYARRLVAVDTTELTAVQEKVKIIEMEKSKLQMELYTTRLEQRSLEMQLEMLRKNLSQTRQMPKRNWRFALEKNLEIVRDGGCRALAYNCRTYDFYVSQKTSNNLFPGYGVRTVNCVDYKLGNFLHLHTKAIRDIAYSQPSDLLLSVSLDKTARLVERGIQTMIVQCKVPVWSCSWDHVRPHEFYVGAVNGLVMHYDVRNTITQLNSYLLPADTSPVVSVCSTEFGLLSCQLNTCWLWNANSSGTRHSKLPLKGPFMSKCYDHETQKVLVSIRSNSTERARLVLLKVKRNGDSDVSFDVVQDIPGSTRSTLMTRAAWVKCDDAAWVAAYSESDSSLYLHPVDSGRTISLPAAEAALNVCAGRMNGETVLAALSESRLRLYKAVATTT